MNWKEQPHLFANGKFNLKDLEHEQFPIKGIVRSYFILNEKTNQACHIHDCQLIARPISDMSDEELRMCPTFKEKDMTPYEELKYRLTIWTEYRPNEMPAVVERYLLSIGVYPFKDTTDVIWRYENG